MGTESMYNCGMFDKALDEWEEHSTLDQSWEDFITHFQNAEEKFNLKKNIHDKKSGIGRANSEEEIEEIEAYENQDYDVNNISTHLDNLAAASTQEKDVLDRLVSNNKKLVDQLERLTNKFDQLSSNNNSNRNSNSTVTMINGKRLKFVQYEKNGHCNSCGYKCVKGHSSKTCQNLKDDHQKEANRRDTKNVSTKHKNWNFSCCEEHVFLGTW